jgi:hypothetical protein
MTGAIVVTPLARKPFTRSTYTAVLLRHRYGSLTGSTIWRCRHHHRHRRTALECATARRDALVRAGTLTRDFRP